jgi:SAM-dependent methyltransferase
MGCIRPESEPGFNTFINFTENLRQQAQQPPAGDIVMGACYQATVDLIENDQEFSDFIFNILSQRQMVPQHFTNLYFRSIQFLEMFRESNPDYPTHANFKSNKAWQETILDLKKKHESEWADLLLNKDTTTTIYQRYAGAKIVLNALFPGKELKVADFGCGANYGLRGLAQDLPFDNFEDHTPGTVSTLLVKPGLKLAECLAVDRENPDDKDAKLWRRACSFYPQELMNDGMSKMLSFESKLDSDGKVKFLQGDLLNLSVNHHDGTLPEHAFDAVILNTMLYQMTEEEQAIVLESAKKSLNPNGIIIIQDFAVKDLNNPQRLNFDVNWFGREGMYRTHIASQETNWEYKEVLRWENGRCKKLHAGEDFNFLLRP